MRVKDKLEMLGLKPSKDRGQNFLIDDSVINTIVQFGRPEKGENIVEIGPGLGALTRALYPYGNLTLIEIEEKFADILDDEYPEANVICSDVRSVDFLELGEDLVVFGNLPYSFSTDILFFLIDACPNVSRAVLMLQKEFVNRLAAEPGGREFGVLSVSTQLRTDVIPGPVVPGESFHPPTKVDSRIVELRFRDKPRVELSDPLWFKRVVSAAFSRRRKKLSNSLKSSGIADAAVITAALEKAEISGDTRAEQLSIEDFARLAEAFPENARALI